MWHCAHFTVMPRKTEPTVAVISKQEAAELYAIRGLLEGYAAAEFTRHADDASIVRFGEGAEALKVAALSGSQEAVLKAKTDLYDVLLDNCGNGLIKEMLTKGVKVITNMGVPVTTEMMVEYIGSQRTLDPDPKRARVNIQSAMSHEDRIANIKWRGGTASPIIKINKIQITQNISKKGKCLSTNR